MRHLLANIYITINLLILFLIAKAVLDNRMVDLPFSLPFYQWLLREESTLTSQDLRNIDPTIASTVSQLEGKMFFLEIVKRHSFHFIALHSSLRDF